MKRTYLLATSAAVAVTAVVGSAGTDVKSRWYRRLDKPSWQPPGPAFGIVWTTLYALLAVAGAGALERTSDGRARQGYIRSYAANLALNAGWSWCFFRAKRPRLALAEVALLEASTAELTVRSWRLNRTAGLALLPYAAWVSYATALTAEIARRSEAG
jgi:benzodiazapine receptor